MGHGQFPRSSFFSAVKRLQRLQRLRPIALRRGVHSMYVQYVQYVQSSNGKVSVQYLRTWKEKKMVKHAVEVSIRRSISWNATREQKKHMSRVDRSCAPDALPT